jgi:hypothetical protein
VSHSKNNGEFSTFFVSSAVVENLDLLISTREEEDGLQGIFLDSGLEQLNVIEVGPGNVVKFAVEAVLRFSFFVGEN